MYSVEEEMVRGYMASYKMEKIFILRIFSVILFLECFFDNDYDLTDKGNLSII